MTTKEFIEVLRGDFKPNEEIAGDAEGVQTPAFCQSIGPPGRADFSGRMVSAQITDPPTLPAGQALPLAYACK